MYKIVDEDGNLIAQVDSPRYVRFKAETGTWIRCPPIQAECIAVKGMRYSIAGRELVDDAPTVAYIIELDAAAEALKTSNHVKTNSTDIDNLSWAIAQLTKELVEKLSF